MPMYDFRCQNAHVTEKLESVGCESIECPLCGDQAIRQFSRFNRVVEPAAVPRDQQEYRKDFRLFQEASQEISHAADKFERDTGRKANLPNYYRLGRRQAALACR